MATNYYKALTGSAASHTLRQEAFPFSDGDADEARLALSAARSCFPADPMDPPVVSVWRRSAVVPSYIPEIGVAVGGRSEDAGPGIVDVNEMAADAAE